jgi:hypothetical protein
MLAIIPLDFGEAAFAAIGVVKLSWIISLRLISH